MASSSPLPPEQTCTSRTSCCCCCSCMATPHPFSVKLKYFHVLLLTLSFLALNKIAAREALLYLLGHHLTDSDKLVVACVLVVAACGAALWASWGTAGRRAVYMVDFACYRPEDDRKVSKQYFITNSGLIGLFTGESLEFQRKILERSGLGQETYFPPAVTNLPPNPCLLEARAEAETVMFGAMDELFSKTGIPPSSIGILVVNCSAFCPSPSLASLIIRKYNLPPSIAAYNLGGMGCSAGVIALDLAHRLLCVRPNTYAVAISTENITLNWYRGNHKTMLVSNCIFRMGGSAVLLSNKPSSKHSAKFQLSHVIRTHKGADDKGFFCVQHEEDPTGILGVTLSKELMSVAGSALRTNITTLGPLVLPLSEQFKFFASLIGKYVLKMSIKPYTPDFTKAFEHFCVHAGGRAVLDEVEKNLKLSPYLMEPNRMTLHRFGNTSSSSLWYELAYIEAKGRVRAGDRIWQIGFGSGFKCNSAVWHALRDIPAETVQNCWSSFIDSYPVHIPAVDKIDSVQLCDAI